MRVLWALAPRPTALPSWSWRIQCRTINDIRYYDSVEYSHLHEFGAQSARRKFLLQLEKRKEELAAAQRRNTEPQSAVRYSELRPVPLPRYVFRQPSQILRTLASAVGKDYTAADYKYHDDPYLIPYNSMQKRDFMAHKEGGKRAARFILDTHPELFEENRIYAHPPIKAFMPRAKISPETSSVALLKTFMEGFNVDSAVQVYESLADKQQVDMQTKLRLLQLLAYHNESEPLEEDHQEWAGFWRTVEHGAWKQGKAAESLHLDITCDPEACEQDKMEAELTLLMGMAKHNYQGALEQYDKCQAIHSLDKFHAGLQCCTLRFASNLSDCWADAEAVLKDMAQLGIAPTGVTLILLLDLLHHFADKENAKARQLSLSTLAEFKRVGVEPSLGAYSKLLNIFCPNREDRERHGRHLAQALIHQVESLLASLPSHNLVNTVIHKSDLSFFSNVIEHLHRQDLPEAYRLHDIILSHPDHIVLLGNNMERSNFYKELMVMVLKSEGLDDAMEFYNQHVIHTFSPNLSFYHMLIKHLRYAQGHRHVPKVWADIIITDFVGVSFEKKLTLIKSLMELITTVKLDVGTEGATNLQQAFMKINGEAFSHTTSPPRGVSLDSCPDAMDILNHVLNFSLASANVDLAKRCVSFCKSNVLIGSLDEASLDRFVDSMISQNDVHSCMEAILYTASSHASLAIDMAMKVVSALPLDSNYRQQLNLTFAHDTRWTLV